MAEHHPSSIKVTDLEERLVQYLHPHAFRKTTLAAIHSIDRVHLTIRDQRKIQNSFGLRPEQRWRDDADYLLFDNNEGMLAYVRHNPSAPRMHHVLPLEIHFRTAAPRGFTPQQYFSLVAPQRILRLLRTSLYSRGMLSISAIANMEETNVLDRLMPTVDEIEGDSLPAHIFHSTYISVKQNEKEKPANGERIVEDLAMAIGSVIVATHLFSRKQIAYYQAAYNVEKLFGDATLVG